MMFGPTPWKGIAPRDPRGARKRRPPLAGFPPPEWVGAWQIRNLGYSRLQICVTTLSLARRQRATYSFRALCVFLPA
jgi:hypothetical protein